jgi:hypothetical protein
MDSAEGGSAGLAAGAPAAGSAAVLSLFGGGAAEAFWASAALAGGPAVALPAALSGALTAAATAGTGLSFFTEAAMPATVPAGAGDELGPDPGFSAWLAAGAGAAAVGLAVSRPAGAGTASSQEGWRSAPG